MSNITAGSLGSAEFRSDHSLRYAYVAGAMYKGIASPELVVALGAAGMLGYFGTGGLQLAEIESAIRFIKARLIGGESYGMNLLCNLEDPEVEDRTVDLYLRHGILRVEAAAYMSITPSLVRYRLTGVNRSRAGFVFAPHHILAKVSRPEVAEAFMQPPPPAIVAKLRASGQITSEEAELAPFVPMSGDICVESDSGGHTDQGVAFALIPAILTLRDLSMQKHDFAKRIRVGAAGGIGTPHAVAAAFVLGIDFVLTGSINQCTCEARTSDAVKDLLQELNVQDTAYAPAGDMFELGSKIQVARKGLFFAARANKLYELYQRYDSLEAIDQTMRRQVEDKYFKKSFDDIWQETRAHYLERKPHKLPELEAHPKRKMAAVFRWYFRHSTGLALEGNRDKVVDYQIHCGPALGAFNEWVKPTPLRSWRNRRVAVIGERLMVAAAQMLSDRFRMMAAPNHDQTDGRLSQDVDSGTGRVASPLFGQSGL
jgi:trans-AT polyketide synthase, acyltransferase and oxidoreductase domains